MTKNNIFMKLLPIIVMWTLVLAACTHNGENGTDGENAGGGNASATTLKLLVMEGFEGQYQPYIDAFNTKYPTVSIKLETYSISGNNNEQIEKQFFSKAASSDIVEPFSFNNMAIDGKLEDLTPYIENDEILEGANLAEGFLVKHKSTNKVYALRHAQTSQWVYINKDMMRSLQMEMPSNDWTYDDLLDMAIKATNPEKGEYGLSELPYTSSYVIANGHSDNFYYANMDWTQSIADDPEIWNDIQWIQDLIYKWKVIPMHKVDPSIGWSDEGDFASNKALFTFVTPRNTFRDLKTEFLDKLTFEWDILPMPRGLEKQVTAHFISSFLGITANSDHKEEAFLFLNFFYEIEGQKLMVDQGLTPFVSYPEVDQYIAETWGGKNYSAIKHTMDSCCYYFSARANERFDSLDYQMNVVWKIDELVKSGGHVDDIKSAVESWNQTLRDE